MKKIFLYMMALASAFSVASCSDDDDTPRLSGVESGTFSLSSATIDGKNDSYTFLWTNTRFYIDGDMQKAVSLVGYEKNGIDYQIKGVETGKDIETEGVTFGSVVSQNYLTLDYESIAKIMQQNFGMVRSPENESESSIDFQLVAKYSSPDTSVVKSNIITVPFTLTVTPPFDGPKVKLFISVATDWSPSTFVYAWANDTDDKTLFGGWGGYKLEGTTVAGPDGNQYYEVPLTDPFYNVESHLIIHDEVNDGDNRVESQPVLAVKFGEEEEDVYLRVTGNSVDGYDVKRIEKPLPKLYIKSDLGWTDYALYAWAGSGDVEAAWPGILPTGKETINGEEWLVFEPSKPYTKVYNNWIINANGSGPQFDLMSNAEFTKNTFVRVAADGSYTVAYGPIVSDGYVVYINDLTGWDAIALYQWGEVNDFGGGWPGKLPDGTVTIGGVTYKYFKYGADVKGLNQNLIFNNNNNDNKIQLGDYNFTFESDIFLTVTTAGVTE